MKLFISLIKQKHETKNKRKKKNLTEPTAIKTESKSPKEKE